MRHRSVLACITRERTRQERKAVAGDFGWTCSDPGIPDFPKLAVLVEEVGEVGRAILGADGAVTDGGDLRQELIQVAAVAVAWLESLPE